MTLRTTAVLIGCVRAASGAMGVAGVRRATVHASASSAAKPAVLWLHGLGDTGAGWQGAFGPLAFWVLLGQVPESSRLGLVGEVAMTTITKA